MGSQEGSRGTERSGPQSSLRMIRLRVSGYRTSPTLPRKRHLGAAYTYTMSGPAIVQRTHSSICCSSTAHRVVPYTTYRVAPSALAVPRIP
eukprot:3306341-Rhodomonas_salina.1